jgi:DNA-binding IscR family transcriptional regulator
MLELAASFGANAGAQPLPALAERTGLDEEPLWGLLGELRRVGLVAEVHGPAESAWIVARPPEQIVVTDVLAALRGKADDAWREPGGRSERARAALLGLARAERDALENRTLRELADERRASGASAVVEPGFAVGLQGQTT